MSSKKCEWKDGVLNLCDSLALLVSKTPVIENELMSWNECPYCKEAIIKPIEYEVGMFGQFFDNEDEPSDDLWGYLAEYDSKFENPFTATWGDSYSYFMPGLPTDVNSDGTPKKEKV
jgi:hypothetical protein